MSSLYEVAGQLKPATQSLASTCDYYRSNAAVGYSDAQEGIQHALHTTECSSWLLQDDNYYGNAQEAIQHCVSNLTRTEKFKASLMVQRRQ